MLGDRVHSSPDLCTVRAALTALEIRDLDVGHLPSGSVRPSASQEVVVGQLGQFDGADAEVAISTMLVNLLVCQTKRRIPAV